MEIWKCALREVIYFFSKEYERTEYERTAEKYQNKTDLLQEFDQRAHCNYLRWNNYNLKKRPFHQVQQYKDQYTKRLLPISLMKIAYAGLRKALQAFGDK